MSNRVRERAFVEGLVENAGWDAERAGRHFHRFAAMFEIGDAVEFTLSEAKRLSAVSVTGARDSSISSASRAGTGCNRESPVCSIPGSRRGNRSDADGEQSPGITSGRSCMRIGTGWWPVVVLVIGIGVIGCEAQEAEDTDVEADVDTTASSEDTVSPEQGLESLARKYERAYGERDAPALSALHTRDYLEISPEGEVRTATMLDSILQDTSQMGEDLAIDTESMVVAESGDIAYGTGVTTLRGADPEGEAFTAESRWLAGFKKVDGEWKLDRLMTSTPTPVETTPGAAGPPSGPAPPAEDGTGGS